MAAFFEWVHRARRPSTAALLASIHRKSRYVLLIGLLALASGVLGSDWQIPYWLRLKITLFARVIASGVGIRLALIPLFRNWQQMMVNGSSNKFEKTIQRCYSRATGILVVLWLFILGIAILSIARPTG